MNEIEIKNISRDDPNSQILYRLRYICIINLRGKANGVKLYFIKEVDPLGQKIIRLENDSLPSFLLEDPDLQVELVRQLQKFLKDDKIPR